MNGHFHPITTGINKISKIFNSLGFTVVDGPELENEWFNFDALNVPKDHPSRDMQDTFIMENMKQTDPYGDDASVVLRTHTSNMQIRSMIRHVESGSKFPLAIVAPGKVFRNEATDRTHEAQFYQVEMLYVGKDASMAMLIGIMEKFFSEFFEKELHVRLRSSFFPFVEPGAEFDIECMKCGGSGCAVCKNTGWIEVGGAGLVHPKVLEAGKVNSTEYRGIAFGCGIDRLLMIKYGIDDVRLLYNGDIRLPAMLG